MGGPDLPKLMIRYRPTETAPKKTAPSFFGSAVGLTSQSAANFVKSFDKNHYNISFLMEICVYHLLSIMSPLLAHCLFIGLKVSLTPVTLTSLIYNADYLGLNWMRSLVQLEHVAQLGA